LPPARAPLSAHIPALSGILDQLGKFVLDPGKLG